MRHVVGLQCIFNSMLLLCAASLRHGQDGGPQKMSTAFPNMPMHIFNTQSVMMIGLV